MNEPRPVVVDASVAVAILRKEPEGAAAVSLISQWTRDGARMVVPSHFWLEVVNALVGRHRWPGADILQSIHDLDRLRVETVDLDRASVVLVIDVCERHRLTAYDAAYLALAVALDGSLMTLDARLRMAAGTRAIHLGPARLSEVPAVYEHPVTWPMYKGASAYLAKLRAEAGRPG
jgi:predicted nucleic acid-binding protein